MAARYRACIRSAPPEIDWTTLDRAVFFTGLVVVTWDFILKPTLSSVSG
jgi:hypothetical protein